MILQFTQNHNALSVLTLQPFNPSTCQRSENSSLWALTGGLSPSLR